MLNISSGHTNELLEASLIHYYRDTLRLPDWYARVQKRLTMEEAESNINRIKELLGDLEGKSVLDLGCGWGDVVLKLSVMTRAKYVLGIEPDRDRASLALSRGQNSDGSKVQIIIAVGESVPLPSNSVDIVCAYQVLEHVNSRQQVVEEMLRVLKPGGYIHMIMPNYAAFYEAHYKIKWMPFFPRPLAALYLKLRGRPTDFLSMFEHVYPWQIKGLFLSMRCTVRDLAHEQLLARIQRPIGKKARIVRRLVSALELLPLGGRLRNQLAVVYQWLAVKRQEYLIAK